MASGVSNTFTATSDVADNGVGGISRSRKHEALDHIPDLGPTLDHKIHMPRDMCLQMIRHLLRPQNQNKGPSLNPHARGCLDWQRSHL